MFTFLPRAPQAGGCLLCSQPGVEFRCVWHVSVRDPGMRGSGFLGYTSQGRCLEGKIPDRTSQAPLKPPLKRTLYHVYTCSINQSKPRVLEQLDMNRLFPRKRVDRVGGRFLWRRGDSCFNFSSPGGTLIPTASLEQVPIWMPVWDSKCKLWSWAMGPWIPIGQNVQVYWLGGSGVLSIPASRESALHVG